MLSPAPPTAAPVFFDPGPLIDRDLHLIPPDPLYIDDLLSACHHPLSRRLDPGLATLTRQDILDLIRRAPAGHDHGDPARHRLPGYSFWIRLDPRSSPPIPIAGHLNLRIQNTPETTLYLGHVGYTVYPPARGQHLAERAVRLLLPLARRHGLNPFWITTDPDNLPSRRTCERLGACLVDTIAVPPDHLLHQRGQRFKCRYRIDL